MTLWVAFFVTMGIGATEASTNSPGADGCPTLFARLFSPVHVSQSLKNSGRFQEAMWVMRENGLLDEADLLEAELKQAIASGREIIRTSTFSGANNAGRVYLGSKLSGLFRVGFGHQHEVAAYKLDRLLGLNVVPLTVKKEIGGRVGSFQLWMPHTSTNNNPLNRLRFADQRHRRLLNFLIDATDDTNPGNILFTRRNHVAAIDNQLSFSSANKLLEPFSKRELQKLIPDYAVYLKLKEVDEATLRQEILPQLVEGENAFAQFLKRRAFLIEAIEKQIAERGLNQVFPEL